MPRLRARTPSSAGGRLLRRSAIGAACLSLSLLAASCSNSGGSGASGNGQQITVAVAPGLDTAPLTVAVNRGLFTQHGLNVRIRAYSSVNAAFNALSSGRAEIAAGDYTDFFYQVSLGKAHLHLVADAYDATAGTTEILTLRNTKIGNPQQLVGKTIGTPEPEGAPFRHGGSSPYNIQTLAAQSVLQSDGVSPSSVTWRPMPAGQMVSALAHHTVDAILVSEPYIIQAESRLGAVQLLDAASGVTANLPVSGYFSMASYAGQQPHAVAAFEAALNTAQGNSAQRGTVQTALATMSSGAADMSPSDAAMVTLGQYPTFLNVGQVQRVANLMYDSGMIGTPISVHNLVG